MHAEFAQAEIDQRHTLVDPPDHPDHVADRIDEARARGLLSFTNQGG